MQIFYTFGYSCMNIEFTTDNMINMSIEQTTTGYFYILVSSKLGNDFLKERKTRVVG